MNKKITLFNVLLLTSFISFSQVDLQITEIWPGNELGENLTEDWFEITNNGDVAWTSAAGNLYFDDDSQDFEDAVLISGISSIQPGESVIAINAADTSNFTAVWGSVYTLTDVKIGTYDGKGLGGGGDGVTLFMSIDAPTDASTIIDFEEYPDASSNGGQSYDVVKEGFSSVADGAVATAVNDENEAAIGSPGNLGAVALNTFKSNVNENTLKIFPSPFNNEVNISLNLQSSIVSNVKVINTLGTVVYSDNILLSNGITKISRLSQLPAGIYILHISELNISTKIVKK